MSRLKNEELLVCLHHVYPPDQDENTRTGTDPVTKNTAIVARPVVLRHLLAMTTVELETALAAWTLHLLVENLKASAANAKDLLALLHARDRLHLGTGAV